MRRIPLLLAVFSVAMASSAGAVELHLVGESASGISFAGPGQEVTIELRMTNASQDAIYGLGASVHGYGDDLELISGRAVRRYLNDGDGTYLPNLAGTATGTGAAQQRVLAESEIGTNGPRVQIALSATTAEQLGVDPSLDPGLEGGQGAMFRLVFRVSYSANFPIRLKIDSTYQGDLVNLAGGASTEIVGTTFLIGMPEPGTTLLIGLGLAGLAASNQRERARVHRTGR